MIETRNSKFEIRNKFEFSFVTPLGHFDLFIHERLFVHHWRLARALIFPGRNTGEVFVVASGFAILVLEFLAEMAAAGFASFKSVEAEEFSEFHEVGDASSIFEDLVEFAVLAGDIDVFPEFLA